MKQLLTALVLALSLSACASEEPKQTEQPAQTQQAQASPVSIDDAPAVDPMKQTEPETPKKVEAVTEAPAKAEVHLVSMNVKSHKYHEPGCRYYGCHSCDEMSLEEAIAAGGVPCKKCH
jgi:PBP1b-binding outer membrane lipoprotein LpoB